MYELFVNFIISHRQKSEPVSKDKNAPSRNLQFYENIFICANFAFSKTCGLSQNVGRITYLCFFEVFFLIFFGGNWKKQYLSVSEMFDASYAV